MRWTKQLALNRMVEPNFASLMCVSQCEICLSLLAIIPCTLKIQTPEMIHESPYCCMSTLSSSSWSFALTVEYIRDLLPGPLVHLWLPAFSTASCAMVGINAVVCELLLSVPYDGAYFLPSFLHFGLRSTYMFFYVLIYLYQYIYIYIQI